MGKKSILLVEDDESLRNAILIFLGKCKEYDVTTAPDMRSAKIEIETKEFDLILSDIKMPGGSGIDLLAQATARAPKSKFILMTGYGTVEQAVQAMKNGAYDFLEKPFDLDVLKTVVDSAIRETASAPVVETPVSHENAVFESGDKILITENEKMMALVKNLKKIASSKATVLIQGESGTGKEVLANMVHDYSPRKNNPFVAINCAALPDNLLESELFGHEKGSFTGAIQRQLGKFEIANGGTILLDEISEMSLNMQTKLLRVLQEREIYRIGGNKPIPLNIRIIAATNRNLYQYMKEGNFREDLFYRINVIPVVVPPLRERGSDVIALCNHFLDDFARIHERDRIELDELAQYKILGHPWQGNVRELRNAMERAILIGSFDQIGAEEAEHADQNAVESLQNISQSLANTATESAEPVVGEPGGVFQSQANVSLAELEKQFIFETLKRCDGNRTRTAEKLGISLRTLRNKLKAFKEQDEANA